MSTLMIGQVARNAGVGIETIRFYEREGLLEVPPRRSSGYCQYPEHVVQRIHFIKRAQQLGFSLKEISELLALRVDGHTSCEEVRQRAELFPFPSTMMQSVVRDEAYPYRVYVPLPQIDGARLHIRHRKVSRRSRQQWYSRCSFLPYGGEQCPPV